MKQSVKKELQAIVGANRVTDKPEDLVAYSYDPHTEEHLPELVIYPLTTEEVSEIMKIAFRDEIPVTARGSGTNLAGETVPIKGGIVMALTRMDKIIEIDPHNRAASIQPGVINFDFQQEVEKHGLMYPPDPSSWKMATMGGTVGTNAGGPKTLKYGVTRDYLLGVTAVLADGGILKTGGKAIKNVTGYDLTRLMCGSEGTLGIVTEIMVRLIPKPKASRTMMAYFPKLEDSSDAVAAIIAAGIIPAGLELMDNEVVAVIEASAKLGLPTDVDAVLLIEVDGDPESLDNQIKKIEKIVNEKNASGVVIAKNAEEAEKLWTGRRSAISVMARLRPNVAIEDATVPVTEMTKMIRKVVDISKKYDLKIGVLAHAGDGNLHPLILFDQRDKDEFERVEKATEEIFTEAMALGGTLSGEHGIGLAKARFLPMQMDNVAMWVTKRIKQSFDPKGILNPGKFV
ncbi:FAD-binding oxidoreductase [Thermodesulfobacteriota bacterium]